jgi:hypothetical protein
MEKVKFCCEIFPKLAGLFIWFNYTNDEGVKVYTMPSLCDGYGVDGKPYYWRVNNCPSCGAVVRPIEVPEEQYKEITNG